MLDEAGLEELNEHLSEVRPIFDSFCARHGFVYVNRTALGRYPRIRIEKTVAVTIWFDLWMGLDEGEKRFELFNPDLPYDLSAGAYVIVEDRSKHGTRYDITIACFLGKPFRDVPGILEREMERHLSTLEKWDAGRLIAQGRKVKLGR